MGNFTITAGLHSCWLQMTVTVGVGDPERAVAISTSLRGLPQVPQEAYWKARLLTFATRSSHKHLFPQALSLTSIGLSLAIRQLPVTCSEWRTNCYNPETQLQSSQWRNPSSPCPMSTISVGVKYQEDAGDHFWLYGHWSAGICSFRSNG
jgi:hypothetical protein